MQSHLGNRSPGEPSLSERPVEVYLESCSIRGLIETTQTRVSDHLGTAEETIRLKGARVVIRDGTELASNAEIFINKAVVLFVVDLSPRPTGQLGFQVRRDVKGVTVNIGTLWIRGQVHLPVGGDLQSFYIGAINRFMAITQATVVGREQAAPRTFLINRDQVRCLMAS